MRRRVLQGACVVPLLVAGGCLPIPHRVQRAPELGGVVRQVGQPLGGVPVKLSVNPPARELEARTCSSPIETRTDSAGRFLLPRTREWTFWYFMGDRFDRWALCFLLPDGERAIWSGGSWFGGPPKQELDCELGPPQPGAEVKLPWLPSDVPTVGCRAVNVEPTK